MKQRYLQAFRGALQSKDPNPHALLGGGSEDGPDGDRAQRRPRSCVRENRSPGLLRTGMSERRLPQWCRLQPPASAAALNVCATVSSGRSCQK